MEIVIHFLMSIFRFSFELLPLVFVASIVMTILVFCVWCSAKNGGVTVNRGQSSLCINYVRTDIVTNPVIGGAASSSSILGRVGLLVLSILRIVESFVRLLVRTFVFFVSLLACLFVRSFVRLLIFLFFFIFTFVYNKFFWAVWYHYIRRNLFH